jgi:two-component system response regulator NreC
MHRNEDYVCECLMSGANGYILKEDADIELMNALHTILNDKLYVSPLLSSDIIRNLIARKPNPRVSVKNPSMRRLTPREQEVLTLIVEGYSNKKIGDIFSISVRTVEHHRLSAMRKLGTSNTVDLIKRAIKSGLVNIV